MASLVRTTEWQRKRAELIHREFLALETAVTLGARVDKELGIISERLSAVVIEWTGPKGRIKSKPLKASKASLYRALAEWREGGRTQASLIHDYHSAGHHAPMPADLEIEIRTLASAATGGRNKEGLAPATYAVNQLKKDWQAGKSIPGLGTWEEWWRTNPETASLPLPETAPDFPFCDRTITRKVGHVAIRKIGNVGFAAAKKHLSQVERDYSQLRKAEMFTLDDVRLDLMAIDELTSQVIPVEAYIMMEVGSRMIVSFILRPKGPVLAADVKCLLGAGLAVTGLPLDYKCVILFERGTIACSDALQEFLEGASNNIIEVRRTGMTGGVKWIGAAADKARGNSAGKAVIESFNRSLHARLLHLPGQRGNTYENEPYNLGVSDRDQLKGSGKEKGFIGRKRKASPLDGTGDSLIRHTEYLCRFKRTAIIHGFECDLLFPFLTVAQLEAEVQEAINAHNHDPGHNYQGHHKRAMVKGPGGVRRPLNHIGI